MADDDETFSVSLEEMGQFDGCLLGVMALALRWGVVDIPKDQQVCVQGLKLHDENIVDRGMVFLLPREPGAPQWVSTDDDIGDCSVLFVAETFLDIIEAALEAEYKMSVPEWGTGC